MNQAWLALIAAVGLVGGPMTLYAALMLIDRATGPVSFVVFILAFMACVVAMVFGGGALIGLGHCLIMGCKFL